MSVANFISYLQETVMLLAKAPSQSTVDTSNVKIEPSSDPKKSTDTYTKVSLASLPMCRTEQNFCKDIARWSEKKPIEADTFLGKNFYRMRSLESLEINDDQLIVTIDGKQQSVDLPLLENGERKGTYPRRIISDPQIIFLNDVAQSKAIYYEYYDSFDNKSAVILVPVRHKMENGWQVLGVDLDGSHAPSLFYRYNLEQIINETLGVS